MKLFAWGTNSHGQLGLGFSSELVAVPQEVVVPNQLLHNLQEVKISGGGNHTIIQSVEGMLYGAGLNDAGQFGCDGLSRDTFSLIETSAKQEIIGVSCGWDFTIFLTTHLRLFGCGSNKFKQIRQSCMEKHIKKLTPLDLDQEILQASAGLRHVSAISVSGDLLIWGDEKHVKPVTGLSLFTKVAAGQKHTVALKDGEIYAWGSNTHGQCGVDPNATKVVLTPSKIKWDSSNGNIADLCCGWTHTVLLTDRGHVYSWGRNCYGQLGRQTSSSFFPQRIPELEQVVSVASGSEHCMALDANGQLWTWGWNEHGSCGTGDTLNQFRPKNISQQFPSHVLSIGCGAGHCFAVVG